MDGLSPDQPAILLVGSWQALGLGAASRLSQPDVLSRTGRAPQPDEPAPDHTSATILAVVPVATMVGMLAYGLPLAGFPVRIVVPLDGLAISLGFTGAVTILAVWLPTWGPLRLPERRVIARLVAE